MSDRGTPTADILIVDDTLANLRLMTSMLSESGYKVRGVPDGAMALTAVASSPPDLILLDINMPQMNGFEVCQRLKADESTANIPVIFISALDDTKDKVNAFTEGGVDYITKPVQVEEVLARIETHLNLRRLQHQLHQTNEELESRVEARTAELKTTLKEREVLLQEVYHRVKNNMQIVSSLLDRELDQIEDPVAQNVLQQTQSRIYSMALVHQELYQSGDLAEINLESYLSSLSSTLFQSYGVDEGRIALVIDVEDVTFDVETAIPLGLIVNELVSNAIKHAFPDDRQGQISIDFHRTEQHQALLTVSDNGSGFDGAFDGLQSKSLGQQLVSDLTHQLDGTLEIRSDEGTQFTIRLPLSE